MVQTSIKPVEILFSILDLLSAPLFCVRYLSEIDKYLFLEAKNQKGSTHRYVAIMDTFKISQVFIRDWFPYFNSNTLINWNLRSVLPFGWTSSLILRSTLSLTYNTSLFEFLSELLIGNKWNSFTLLTSHDMGLCLQSMKNKKLTNF